MREAIVKSIRYNQRSVMIYMDSEGSITKRRVKALSLTGDSFRAYCYLRQRTRTFKIDGVLALVPVVGGDLAVGVV